MEEARQLEVGSLSKPPIVVPESASISKIVGILQNENAYEVFVEEGERVKMVMIRDILRATNVFTEKVGSFAFYVPVLSSRSPLAEAARLMMYYRIRALPIVANGRLSGKVDAISAISAIPGSYLSRHKAQDIMTGNPISLVGEDKVSKARALMVRRKIDHLPVLEQGKLCGILTSSHIVFGLYQSTGSLEGPRAMVGEIQRKLEPPVENLMETNPLTCMPSDRIDQVLQEMRNVGTTYSVATLFSELQGIITYRDFMKLATEEIAREDIPVSIIGLPDDPFEAEQTRTKFYRSVETLKRAFPYIEQAKAIIKTKEPSERTRRRYEVKVTLVTPKRNYIYTNMGYELANIFDDVSKRLKAMMAERPKRRRESIRYQE